MNINGCDTNSRRYARINSKMLYVGTKQNLKNLNLSVHVNFQEPRLELAIDQNIEPIHLKACLVREGTLVGAMIIRASMPRRCDSRLDREHALDHEVVNIFFHLIIIITLLLKINAQPVLFFTKTKKI